MKRRTWVYLAAGTLLLASAIVWSFRPQAVPVEAALVRAGAFEQTIDEDGRTRVRERYVVSAPLSGRLARIELEAGDAVQAGKPVALLLPSAPSLLDARTVRELGERVGAAEAAFAQARAEVARAAVALEQAQADLSRQRQLEADGFVSSAARDHAELTARVQWQALDAARSGADAAGHNLAQARAALLRAREEPARAGTRGALPVTAPVAGKVLRVMQPNEGVVAMGTPLLEIANTDDLEIVVDLLSTDAARVVAGAMARIDAGNGVALDGRVRRIEPSAFTKISALGIEEQRVNVVIDFVLPPVKKQVLGDNYRVDVRIVADARADAVIVPVSSLFRQGADWSVFVLDGRRAVRRTVKLGGRGPIDAWVETGLSAGEKVIVYPSDSVRDGVRIAVVRGAA